MTLRADVFRNSGLRKTWLDQCLKSCASQDPSTDNIANGSKHWSNMEDSTLLIDFKVMTLEKFSFSDM